MDGVQGTQVGQGHGHIGGMSLDLAALQAACAGRWEGVFGGSEMVPPGRVGYRPLPQGWAVAAGPEVGTALLPRVPITERHV